MKCGNLFLHTFFITIFWRTQINEIGSSNLVFKFRLNKNSYQKFNNLKLKLHCTKVKIVPYQLLSDWKTDAIEQYMNERKDNFWTLMC